MRKLKQALKRYLRKKITNLIYDVFLPKEKLEETKVVKDLKNEYLSLNNDFQNYKNDLLQTKNQYGIWIGQLFSLYMFTDDINDKLKELTVATEINQAYLMQSVKKNIKKVVYTCLTGNYDNLPIHSYLDFNYDYVCFTDNENLLKIKNYGAWQIRPLVFSDLDNTKNARWHKTHPHVLFPDYEESIWIDANIAIKTNWIFNLVSEKRASHNILIPIHYERDSIFADIEFVVNILHKETRENADRVISFLKEHDFPDNYGLNETNLIYRKHNDAEIISLMNDWWYFIEKYSKRDQFSFSYVLFKHGIKPSEIAIPNLRPLFNSFRIDAIHRQNAVFKEPSILPDYPVVEKDINFAIETKEAYCAYVRRAGYVALDDDFDVYIRANRYFYKTDKVIRHDVMNNFALVRNDVGFDAKISFFDAAEGKFQLCIANHTKKEMYIKEI